MGDPVSIGLMVASTVFSVASGVQQAKAAEANAAAEQDRLNYIAQQNEQAAGRERANAQRKAEEQRRLSSIRSSRAQAVAAASGTGTLDPSVIDIIGDLEAEGQYRSDLEMYEGEMRARDYETSAELRRYEGKEARRAGKMNAQTGYMKATSSLLKGTTSLADKYGGNEETIYWNDGTTGTYG